MSFGTGAVKITPAHDHNDYECGKRHQLPFVEMMDDEGYITDVAEQFKVSISYLLFLSIYFFLFSFSSLSLSLFPPPSPSLSQGMKRFDARRAVLSALKDKGLYVDTKEHAMVVPICRYVYILPYHL